jgi:hypothetical protein
MNPTNKKLRLLLKLDPGVRDFDTSLTKVKVIPSDLSDREILVFKDYEGEFWGAEFEPGNPFPDGLVVNIRPMKQVVQVVYQFADT